jgi:hypothetical protein
LISIKARRCGAERIICLGDVVGYGADPEWAVDTVMGLADDGAVAVIGNDDHAISTPSETMNAEAQAAVEWTRGRLSRPQRRFLAELPLTGAKTIASMCIPKHRIRRGGRLGRITLDRTLDEEGNNKHVDRMVALRHWAQPLELDESRLTVHVLEAVDPTVDHIVIGARQNSMLARCSAASRPRSRPRPPAP